MWRKRSRREFTIRFETMTNVNRVTGLLRRYELVLTATATGLVGVEFGEANMVMVSFASAECFISFLAWRARMV